MKKLFVSLALCFCMSFALSVGIADKQTPTLEQPQLHAISSNAP